MFLLRRSRDDPKTVAWRNQAQGEHLLLPGGSSGSASNGAGYRMCGKCDELDDKIAHHSQLLSLVTDKMARDGIAGLIAEMKKEKAALHSEAEGK